MLNWLLHHSPLLYFTQSLWRDEAFSILVAEKPVAAFFGKLSFEPPVYYILLHFWMKIFGESEIATRSLSFFAFALATGIVIFWAKTLHKDPFVSRFLPVFFFLNPMLLYYAFEVRTYGWFIFFATLSMFAYSRKKWRLWTAATILGFYTHTYFIFVPFVQVFHYCLLNRKDIIRRVRKGIFSDPMIRFSVISFLIIVPWLIKVGLEMGKLKNSWYFPVNLNLVRSVLGNMFLGYEGTPWYLWKYTAVLSLILAGMSAAAMRKKKNRPERLYYLSAQTLPLFIVIGISFIKPLFVNRYLIPVTIAEIILVAFFLEDIANRSLKYGLAAVLLTGVVVFNCWYPDKHPKLPIRSTITQVNALRTPQDSVFATSSLVFFETLYYSTDRKNVYLYNPEGSPFPWYVGDAAFSSSYMITDLPVYPRRAFLIRQDGTFSIAYRTVMDAAGESRSERK